MTPARRRLLETIVDLTASLHRPPLSPEVARHLGRPTVSELVNGCRRAGLLTPRSPLAGVWSSEPLRLTPAARLELGLPILTYVAWSLPDGAPGAFESSMWVADDAFRVASTLLPGCVPVAALRGLSPRDAPPEVLARFMAGAAQLAAACDACVVWRSRLLTGRVDVRAALAAGAFTVLLYSAETAAGGWQAAERIDRMHDSH